MNMKLTILCDNSVGLPAGVVGKHGFACFIETAEGNVRFDIGQCIGICGNAAAMTLHPDGGRAVCPDPITDDLSLVLGCAHAGMINVCNHVLNTFELDG